MSGFRHGDVIHYFQDEDDLGVVVDGRMIFGADYRNDGKLEIFWHNGHVSMLRDETVVKCGCLPYEGICMAVVANALAEMARDYKWQKTEEVYRRSLDRGYRDKSSFNPKESDMYKISDYRITFGKYQVGEYCFTGWHILKDGESVGGYETYKRAEQNMRGLR